jgi:archaellum biogenesis ATPase FlaH
VEALGSQLFIWVRHYKYGTAKDDTITNLTRRYTNSVTLSASFTRLLIHSICRFTSSINTVTNFIRRYTNSVRLSASFTRLLIHSICRFTSSVKLIKNFIRLLTSSINTVTNFIRRYSNSVTLIESFTRLLTNSIGRYASSNFGVISPTDLLFDYLAVIVSKLIALACLNC